MNYEQKYREALKRIQRYTKDEYGCTRLRPEDIFPELKESEDERIMEKIIATIHLYYGEPLEDEAKEMIAWLEKQGEQKPVFEMKTPEESLSIDSDTYNKIVDECVYGEQKPVDKVEHKFEIGDLITNGILVGEIDEIHEWGYHAYFGDHYADVPDIENWHKWTIADAKAGDVLVNQNGEMPFIFKECKDNHVYCFCGYTNRKDIFFDKFVDSEGEELHWLNLYHEQAYPANKEQRDSLMKAMTDAGYTFDFEKKELKKIERKPVVSLDENGEPILTDFESALFTTISYFWQSYNSGKEINVADFVKEYAPELLEVANKQQKTVDADLKDIVDKEANAIWKEINTGGSHSIIDSFNQFYGICMQVAEAVVDYQKPAWSEDDEYTLNETIQHLEELIRIDITKHCGCDVQYYQRDIDWLKFLKDKFVPQPKQEWKPSEEQINALDFAVDCVVPDEFCYKRTALKSLLTDLRNLTE